LETHVEAREYRLSGEVRNANGLERWYKAEKDETLQMLGDGDEDDLTLLGWNEDSKWGDWMSHLCISVRSCVEEGLEIENDVLPPSLRKSSTSQRNSWKPFFTGIRNCNGYKLKLLKAGSLLVLHLYTEASSDGKYDIDMRIRWSLSGLASFLIPLYDRESLCRRWTEVIEHSLSQANYKIELLRVW